MPNLQKIPSNNLMPGCNYAMAFYGEEDVIRECKLLSRPEHQVYAMKDGETFDVECMGEIIQFRRNGSYPHFLVTDRRAKSGRMKATRVIFYRLDAAPVSITAAEVVVK